MGSGCCLNHKTPDGLHEMYLLRAGGNLGDIPDRHGLVRLFRRVRGFLELT